MRGTGASLFRVRVIFKMREDARALDDADMMQRQERQQRRRFRARMKYKGSGFGDGPARLCDRERLVAADQGSYLKAAPVEPLQLGIRLQCEDGIETVDAAISPHRARRVFEAD